MGGTVSLSMVERLYSVEVLKEVAAQSGASLAHVGADAEKKQLREVLSSSPREALEALAEFEEKVIIELQETGGQARVERAWENLSGDDHSGMANLDMTVEAWLMRLVWFTRTRAWLRIALGLPAEDSWTSGGLL